MIVYDLPGLHNLSVDCGLDSIQWIVSLDFGLWILDCELTNVDGRLHCDLDFGELITLACSPKPLVRLNCLVVRYQPQQSIFDSGDFGLYAARLIHLQPATMPSPAFCNLPTRSFAANFALFASRAYQVGNH